MKDHNENYASNREMWLFLVHSKHNEVILPPKILVEICLRIMFI